MRGTGRTDAPFCYQTLDALAALREHFAGRELTTALALYLALTELANERRAEGGRSGFKAEQKLVADRAGMTDRTVRDYAPKLEAADVLRIDSDPGGSWGWRLVEPGAEAVSGGADPASGETGSSIRGDRKQVPGSIDTSQENDSKKGETPPNPPDEFPAELPDHLHDVAIAAGKVLKRTAIARGQRREVTRRAVGHAVMTYADRDHLKRALDVEDWLTNTTRGQRSPCRDIVQRFRQFLEDSEPMAQPIAGRPPQSSAQPSASSASLREMAADLRSRGQ